MKTPDELPDKPNIFVASNGINWRNTTLIPENLGTIIHPVPKRIDVLNFDRLKNQIRAELDSKATPGDFILISESSIVLMLLLSYFLSNGMKARVIDYDHISRAFRLYTFDSTNGSWTTTGLD